MKLRVIKDSTTEYLGTIEAVAKMPISDGREISKVNAKSMFVKGNSTPIKETQSIWYTDAIKFGYPVIESDDIESQAAKQRKFAEGEWWFYNLARDSEEGMPEALNHPIVKAGYEFAKATETFRQLALRNL